MAVMPISSWMRAVSSTVLRRVEPPAPQVTDTNAGDSSFSSAIARNSESKPASVLGGKNSNEITGRPRPNCSRMRMTPSAFLARSRAPQRPPILAGVNASARARRRVLTSRIPIRFMAEGTEGVGHLKNVSRAGMFVRSNDLPRPECSIAIQFDAPETGVSINLRGEVRWTTDGNGHRRGSRLRGPAPRAAPRVRRLLPLGRRAGREGRSNARLSFLARGSLRAPSTLASSLGTALARPRRVSA